MNEIQTPRKRKGVIDFDRLIGLLGLETYDEIEQLRLNGWKVQSKPIIAIEIKRPNGRKALLCHRGFWRGWGVKNPAGDPE